MTTSRVPVALETEADVLGICLEEGMSWWNLTKRQVQADDIRDLFHEADHRTIVAAFERVDADGGALTRSSVLDALARDSGSETLAPNPESYVDSLARRTTIRSLEDLTKSLNILNSKAQLRAQLHSMEKLMERIQTDEPHPNDVVSEMKTLSLASGLSDGISTFGDVIAEVREENTVESAIRLKTNLKEFDKGIRGGIDPGRFMLVAARPGVGKTTHILNMMAEALSQDYLVAFASLETTSRDLMVKMLSTMAYADNDKISKWAESGPLENDGTFESDEWNNIQSAMESLQVAPFYTMFASDIPFGVDSIISNTYKAMQQYPGKPAVLFVDFIQILSNGSFDTHKALNDISRKLKIFAMEANVVVVAVSQLNREGADQPPVIHHLRGSGGLEENADLVVLLDRPSTRDESMPEDLLKVNVVKSRLGSPFVIDALWVPELQAVADYSMKYPDVDEDDTPKRSSESKEYFTATGSASSSESEPKKRRRAPAQDAEEKPVDGEKKVVRRRKSTTAPKEDRPKRRASRRDHDDEEDFH